MARDDAILGWDGSHAHRMRIDSSTHAINIIDYAHHEIHDGNSYSCTYSVASIGELDNDLMQLTWTTPNSDSHMHITKEAKCGAVALYKFTEGWTGGGTAVGTLVIDNRDRNSLNTSGVTISYGVTAVTGGTVLKEEYLSSGKFGSGETRDQNEWILKPNTKYAVSLFLSTANEASITLHWYMHTYKG